MRGRNRGSDTLLGMAARSMRGRLGLGGVVGALLFAGLLAGAPPAGARTAPPKVVKVTEQYTGPALVSACKGDATFASLAFIGVVAPRSGVVAPAYGGPCFVIPAGAKRFDLSVQAAGTPPVVTFNFSDASGLTVRDARHIPIQQSACAGSRTLVAVPHGAAYLNTYPLDPLDAALSSTCPGVSAGLPVTGKVTVIFRF
jgi:hypothetical protein